MKWDSAIKLTMKIKNLVYNILQYVTEQFHTSLMAGILSEHWKSHNKENTFTLFTHNTKSAKQTWKSRNEALDS